MLQMEVELESDEIGLSFHQALSIRKQLLVRKALDSSRKLKDERILRSIVKEFEHHERPLLEIAQKHDLPPVSLFRAIVGPRVLRANPRLTCLDTRRPAGRIVQSIISESNQLHVDTFLSGWELKQLQTAKAHDIVGYQNNNCTVGEDWEQAVYNFLDERGISYITEESMKHDTTVTPDCLLVDDLFINGKQIKWIEVKSFYASGLRQTSHFTRGIASQVERYESEFGQHGAVILRNGYTEKISRKYPSTLFLDGGPLNPESKNEL